MKNIKTIYFAVFTGIFLFVVTGCSKVENELTQGTDYTLNTQQDVAQFKTTEGIRTLTISGNNITDVSMLSFKTVKTLIIENTSIKNLSLPQLTSVTSSLIIQNNDVLESVNMLTNFKFLNGNLNIVNNKLLTDISGFLQLKVFKGNLLITDNVLLGENLTCTSTSIGFCVIKYLLENSIISGTITLSNNHPKAVTDASLIGVITGGNIISYTLGSKADIENFAPQSDTVQNLTISGIDITDNVLSLIKDRIKGVKGTVSITNTSIKTTENFFEAIKCNGSIILRNNLELTNPQGFKGYILINGDLIIENCPKLNYWGTPRGGAGFSGVVRIEGSLKLNPVPEMAEGGAGLISLIYVGGDFEIVGDRTKGGIYNLDTWYQLGGGIKHIGGSLIYNNHYMVNGLGGFENLEYLGGDVTILDNGVTAGTIPLQSLTNQVGFCLIKKFLDSGIIKKSNPTIQLRVKPGDPFIEVNTLIPCNK
ncbi:hypothetical protein [Pedobacter cryophilus]|uniref:Receptor L-domain domain-containing protein n=1 Tax=Pedobacter cryophilus TaxID=2571271 RepID=A0A4U1BVX7_9SPHI|nr:hypothetical protein [Pedobacter cryophilus]TKB96377.1 hypothetical protein FA046_14455 [Pedobacter cryophilus]